ncbi:G patch domain-containing protein 1 homolog [Galleria mellonella]|uniref:G patch domain-containing protein 1 homolog n=1 Tax=Galleria mellonella TaxID=7137 RepID=A0A6J1WAQ9_GALME|nr:G patch domain-containing protein 1 homolog [Galleria mellonella]
MSECDSDEDNVIRYGTPLDPFEEDELPSKRKYQQPADQYAVDSHGRRRFHGAFTGGFSAGFGNTVGTPEGWTPASFKSSRSEKAQISSQKAEDFMDDEDRSEFGIAPRHMQTQHEFSGQKRKIQQRYHDGPIPGEPVLEQLVKAVHETAAVRMLRAMGWRPGQGAGDRVSRADKVRAKRQHKVYGCYMPQEMRPNQEPASDNDSSDSEFDYETLFAPDDYEPYVLSHKNDKFGLGYSGLSRHSVLGNLMGEYGSDASTSKSHLIMKEKGKKVSIRGQAFGVGAFEADDEDIYATEDMSHYDFTLGGATEDKQKKKVKEKGVNVLEGFVKASKPLPQVPFYPPPALPKDYKPAAAGARRSRFEPTDQPQRDQGLGRHELTADARGALLGETPVPKVTDTNTQTNIPSTEDPIAKLVGRNVNFTSNQEEKSELDFISIKDSEKEITKVFRPFMNNPKKQARYELYLKDRDSYMKEGDGEMDRLSEWERNREIVEFEQAAKLYKPLTGIMSDRFTHASEPDEALNPLCAVAKSSTNYGLATPEQIDAAKRGVYGVMTRRESPWRPESLVCKRFNIPEPGGVRPESKKEDKPKVSYSVFSYLESSVHDRDSFAKEQSKFSGSKSLINTPNTSKEQNKTLNDTENVKRDDNKLENNTTSQINTGFSKRLTVAELFLKESEKDMKNKEQGVEVTETIDKFDKMDLYKSIFLSDSEDEGLPKNEESNDDKDANEFVDVPKNIERNTSPPRGIFANIDFDELNSWKRNVDNKQTNNEKEATSSANVEKNDKEAGAEDKIEIIETYGPKIPDNLMKRLEGESKSSIGGSNLKPVFRSQSERDKEILEGDSSSSADSWVDVKEIKSKKEKKKKSKKHKSKHKKSKHKKKSR